MDDPILCKKLIDIIQTDNLQLQTNRVGHSLLATMGYYYYNSVLGTTKSSQKLFIIDFGKKELVFWEYPRCESSEKLCRELALYLKDNGYKIAKCYSGFIDKPRLGKD